MDRKEVMRMWLYMILWPGIILLYVLLVSGCSLLPKEDEPRPIKIYTFASDDRSICRVMESKSGEGEFTQSLACLKDEEADGALVLKEEDFRKISQKLLQCGEADQLRSFKF